MNTPGSTEGKREQSPREMSAIVVADIVGSTGVVAEAGDLAFMTVLREFFDRVKRLQAGHQSSWFKTLGDGFMAIFRDGADGFAFALDLQRSMFHEPIRVPSHGGLRLRVGLHVGAILRLKTSYGEDVFGSDVNFAARMTQAAEPGHILVSEPARRALSGKQQLLLRPRAEPLAVKGMPGFHRLSEVDVAGLEA